MASGDKEHRMLFDLRGRRRNVIKVVYATLAVLMGLSLFLVIGGFNIAELFNDGTTTGDTAKPYEEQAERIEAKLKKDPENPDLLLSLTRAQINAGNNHFAIGDNEERLYTAEAAQQYQKAYQSWSEYLEATEEPNPSLALVVAPMLTQMAEFARSYGEFDRNMQGAVDAQKIVAQQRPSVNAYSTLAFYTYFTGNTAAAEEARAKAKKLAASPSERESIDKQLDEYKKNAENFARERAKAAKEQKAESAGGEGGAGSLENPLGGGLSGLGE
jgi:hypothetical protein